MSVLSSIAAAFSRAAAAASSIWVSRRAAICFELRRLATRAAFALRARRGPVGLGVGCRGGGGEPSLLGLSARSARREVARPRCTLPISIASRAETRFTIAMLSIASDSDEALSRITNGSTSPARNAAARRVESVVCATSRLARPTVTSRRASATRSA